MGAGLQPATGCTLTAGLTVGIWLFTQQAMRELGRQRPLADPLLSADQQGVWQTPPPARPVETLAVLPQPFHLKLPSPVQMAILNTDRLLASYLTTTDTQALVPW